MSFLKATGEFLGGIVVGIVKRKDPDGLYRFRWQKVGRTREQNRTLAQQQLAIAHSYISGVNTQLVQGVDYITAEVLLEQDIAHAAKNLLAARNADPSATFDDEQKDRHIWTLDQLSAYALYTESTLHYFSQGWNNEGKDRKHREQGLKAIDKALKYQPQNSQFHLRRGQLLSNLDRKREARKAVDQAIQLDPKNFEAVKYRDRM